MKTTESSHYQTGISLLRQVGGSGYDIPINQLKEIAPDLARLTVEFCYGEIMSRKELDLPTRQLCTVAALAAMGNAAPQLRYHIEGAINVGCAPEAIIEILLLCAVFAGFPAAINGVTAATAVFQHRGLLFQPKAHSAASDRFRHGLAALEQISAGSGKAVTGSLMETAPDLSRFIVEFCYGDILSRSGIDNRTKELAIIALLTAKTGAAPQLKVHISAALNVGVAASEIIEVIQQMAIYAGFPAALNGIFSAQAVLAEQTAAP